MWLRREESTFLLSTKVPQPTQTDDALVCGVIWSVAHLTHIQVSDSDCRGHIVKLVKLGCKCSTITIRNPIGSAQRLLITSSVIRIHCVGYSWVYSVCCFFLHKLTPKLVDKPWWSHPALWTGPDPPEPAQSGMAAVNSDLCRITRSACSAGRVFSMKRGSAFS